MHCFCGSTECACSDVCHCCPFACTCQPCFEIRRRQGGHCRACGGHISTYTCGRIPAWKKSGLYPFPDLEFLRTHPHLSNNSVTDERTSVGRSIPEALQSSKVLQRSVPESPQSPAKEYSTDDDSLMFQMDDIDTTPRASKVSSNASLETKNDVFYGSSHVSIKRDFFNTKQLETNEISSSIPRCCQHSSDEFTFKWTESAKYDKPIRIPRCSLSKSSSTSFKLTESKESQVTTSTQENHSYSHHGVNIQKLEQPQRIPKSPERKFSGSLLKWTESEESELLITKDIPSCSSIHESISKPGETQITDSVSSLVDEYASDSLPSDLTSDSSPPKLSVSLQSPTYPLSTSAPSIYDLPQAVCKLEPSTNSSNGDSETPPVSSLSNLENLKISNSNQRNKASTSSE